VRDISCNGDALDMHPLLARLRIPPIYSLSTNAGFVANFCV